ncbi:MAG: aconitate hydratase AcnA [Terriglobales bacterium]|jgi:aconitate hydratase
MQQKNTFSVKFFAPGREWLLAHYCIFNLISTAEGCLIDGREQRRGLVPVRTPQAMTTKEDYRMILDLAGQQRTFVSVKEAATCFGASTFAQMPYSTRVFAENLLRRQSPYATSAMFEAVVSRRHDTDFPFFPGRVVLQDLTGTPALVDLAGLRDAVAEEGGNPRDVNPLVPTQLVVDHSLTLELAGTERDARQRNMAFEQRRNAERFEFLAWCKRAFSNLDVLMPGNGIIHQINLERLSPVVQVQDRVAFPDTLVGADSHTPMINALGVLGWGVGGIEAESVMLGKAIWMRLPQIIGVELRGSVQPGVLATDLVLALTEFLRANEVVGAILEFHGEAIKSLPLADRATISNMTPEFGATASLFAIDQQTLDFLRLTGRSPAQIALVEAYARAQGLWADLLTEVEYDRRLSYDLSTVGRALAGPASPHQRIPLASLNAKGITHGSPAGTSTEVARATSSPGLPDGAVVIAAIASCTNTSNPRSMIAAGLLARNAVARGLVRKPWVKTSMTPGSQVVERYLQSAGLLGPLQALGFGIAGFACATCNGMSGPLPKEIEAEILARDLHTVAVISGNRNFKGRVHPRIKGAFLASPPLVVAYAITGSMRIDIENAPLAFDANDHPVLLKDLWPDDAEIDAVLAEHVRGEQYSRVYDAMFASDDQADDYIDVPARFPWQEDSTYIRRPPYWEPAFTAPSSYQQMRALAVFGDNVTTDDLSPSGTILPESAAGQYLIGRAVPPADFNSYGTRRGDHLVTIRATLANNRLRNEMTSGIEGSFTRLEPEGSVLPLFEAAERYLARGQELIIVAGRNYGSGSSRDWAAKGVRLLGVRAVVCETFECIHRSNLVGMGVLPLEFESGTTRNTLSLDGSELYSLQLPGGTPARGAAATLLIERRSGQTLRVPVWCRINTQEEVQIFAAGGLLPRLRDEFLQRPSGAR